MIITVLLHKEIQMQTAVVGFPRIGTLRELKFTLEKYFRNEISQEELEQKAAELRRIHWQTQQQAGIIFQAVTFLITTMFWMPHFFSTSFRKDTKNSTDLLLIPILPWHAAIRVNQGMFAPWQ